MNVTLTRYSNMNAMYDGNTSRLLMIGVLYSIWRMMVWKAYTGRKMPDNASTHSDELIPVFRITTNVQNAYKIHGIDPNKYSFPPILTIVPRRTNRRHETGTDHVGMLLTNDCSCFLIIAPSEKYINQYHNLKDWQMQCCSN